MKVLIFQVTLVAILDADKEVFFDLRALLYKQQEEQQDMQGHVILYADKMTDSMQRMIHKCDERRVKQKKYNLQTILNQKQSIRRFKRALEDL